MKLKRFGTVAMMLILTFASLGSRFGYDERCKDLAAGIVQWWFENSPILPPDIERLESFERLGCSDVFLEVERQRIIATGSPQ
jgi:hypothetical protein